MKNYNQNERLKKLKEQHEQGFIESTEFLKCLLDLAKEAVSTKKQVMPKEKIDTNKSTLIEIFNNVKNEKTPVIIERLVNDMDNIVKYVRLLKWQNISTKKEGAEKALYYLIWTKYQIKDKEILDKAYKYIEKYY